MQIAPLWKKTKHSASATPPTKQQTVQGQSSSSEEIEVTLRTQHDAQKAITSLNVELSSVTMPGIWTHVGC